ncbi:glutamate synthase large subunit [Treponema porcinum]|uniref:Glutamate synthase [NADPH] large chain n=1 Tax=Treponema porcinum TaxID=261392 RepID=A0A1T4JHU0_TREPO|nr:glutamate synthase large subunit [Treponema porcinum]SJZ29719.1 glutamate synthase (ferredoxin) [Treponema porcinum]
MNTLYDPSFEHDACGIGAVVNIDGTASRKIVDNALSIVEKLEHRAGKDATGETGDGVGILVQISHTFFKKAAAESGIKLGDERDYGVGMFFFPQDKYIRSQAMKMLEVLAKKEGMKFLGWRTVPVNQDVLGQRAKDCMPCIMQCFIERPAKVEKGLAFDRKLYILRRQFEHSHLNTYIASLSSRTIVYKGMFLVKQLRTFYKDLQSEDYVSAMALVHSRFSTNTNPSWQRAHPNRFIAHNGEINTIRGNADRMLAREETLRSPVFSAEEVREILPAVDMTGSDSAMLDNTLEFLVMNGMPLPLAVMVCIPEPWKNDEMMSSEKKDFYHYWATMMEPWDGPAAILFSDGDVLGATLDRNGLRPSRYYITKDNMLILSSEVGVLDIPEENIVKKSRLQPGRILLVDTVQKRLISDEECKKQFTSLYPYGEWLDMNLLKLKDLSIPNKKIPVYTQEERDIMYRAFGWNYEDVNEMILPMAKTGVEPTASMGVDTPLAVMSDKHPALFNYFKQLFAQVTNPPIDSLREKIVTDTTVYVGSDGNMLEPKSSNCTVLEINNPILTGVDMLKLKNLNRPGLKTAVVSLLYYKNTSLKEALDNLFITIDHEYHNGSNIIILSDRGVDENHVAIPSLLAVSGVEQYLVRTKKRTAISIILESAEVRNVHQAAMILGYGARAVNPYLAHECIAELIDQKLLDKDYHTAIDDYNKGIINGIVKIAAKMGISTIQSYQSAQIFEAVGISKEVIDQYFTNTVSRVGGIGLKEIEDDVNFHHNKAFDPLGLTVNTHLDSVGNHKLRRGPTCEDHLYSPETIIALQESTRNGDYSRFKEYTALVDDNAHPHTLRAMLKFDFDAAQEIPLDEVESVDEIVKRFKTGAMSYGSISQEAHECMALAMNHLHGKSNSGEGGERPERLGTDRNSAIKQVASGRFGVTEEYLLSAKEIQIKMAQGAKPGEGGHLPGKKVYPWIAQTRYATPGVSLISPPPHHDIYSIEDLAQLIYDLKNANRAARISVKLVSEAGVGTIAAGVAKAGAQVILISGHDGGTGAAPLSSIHHAGLPWELGLAETHQTLIQNGLRSRVVIETDGKLMSGRDVAIAALLGAEEFGFATAPLITMGCAMMRVCNLDTCPFGVATQNSELRKRFTGKPEYVENFMKFIAQELREYMAKLGFRTLDEMCGHTELLKIKEKCSFPRANLVDMSRIIGWKAPDGAKSHFDPADIYDFQLEKTVDEKELLKAFEKAKKAKKGTFSISISSTDRTVGTILGSEIQKNFGGTLKDDSFVVNCTGGGGQSFGAFIPKGMTLRLEGDANDYLGKGLSGGKIVVYPSKNATYKAEENIIIGNVALYGATSGEAYINGLAGERFCVRNSGAVAVAEGCGDHGLEYMTGGTAVILGPTGRNLAAGMSGGIAYVLDENHDLYLRLNKQLVSMGEVTDKHDIDTLRDLIERHTKETGSKLGKKILADFDTYITSFKKIIPNDYQRMMTEIAKGEARGLNHEESVMEAFKVVTAGK